MIFESQVCKLIKAELDGISVRNTDRNQRFPIIEDIEAFLKTEVYQSLRKGRLSDSEISFMLNSYIYKNSNLTNLILSKIKDLTISKAISIGALNYVITQREDTSYYARTNFEYDLKNFIKVKDYDAELEELIKFFEYRRSRKIDSLSGRRVFEIFLKNFWYDSSIEYTEGDLKEANKALESIKKKYKTIFELLQEPKHNQLKVESMKFKSIFHSAYASDFNIGSTFDSFDLFTTYNKVSDISKYDVVDVVKTNEIVETILRCPYVDVDFLFDLMNEDKELNSVDKISLLITALISSSLPSFIDFNDQLKKVELLHGLLGVKISISDLVESTIAKTPSRFDCLIRNLETCKNLSKERRLEIYTIYLKYQSFVNVYNYSKLRLQGMIFLQVDDTEMTSFISKSLDKGDNFYELKTAFTCSPKDPSTYPNIKAMIEIAKREMMMYRTLGINKGTDDKTVIETYFFNSSNSLHEDSPITWKMANDPKFMRKIIFSGVSSSSTRINKIISKMNLSSIGFKRYLIYLEDFSREHKLEIFSCVSKNALRYATQSELYMYKRMIPINTIISSPFLGFKLSNYFVSNIENDKFGTQHTVRNLKQSFIIGFQKNKIVTKKEYVNIIARLGVDTRTTLGLHSIDRVPDNRSCIHLKIKSGLSEDVTVKDFCDYYDSLEEGK